MAFSRSLATYQGAGDALFCSNNEITFGTVAEIVATTWLSLGKSTVILQDPFAFFISQIGELNRHVVGGNHHSSILQDLDSGTNLCNPSRNLVLLLVLYFPR